MRDIVTIKITERPLRRGHLAHKSGAGTMGDRRTKRNRTRSSQHRNAIREYSK